MPTSSNGVCGPGFNASTARRRGNRAVWRIRDARRVLLKPACVLDGVEDHAGKHGIRSMNIHHLELFYYVARHGGITEAVRNIPYGIQQPAVSGQVAQLEEYLGVTLFQRRPFALTAAGEKLYQFVQPFFANLDQMAGELQGGKARQIRIGASTIVLREHLPEV